MGEYAVDIGEATFDGLIGDNDPENDCFIAHFLCPLRFILFGALSRNQNTS